MNSRVQTRHECRAFAHNESIELRHSIKQELRDQTNAEF
jgi:hypothetical protein